MLIKLIQTLQLLLGGVHQTNSVVMRGSVFLKKDAVIDAMIAVIKVMKGAVVCVNLFLIFFLLR